MVSISELDLDGLAGRKPTHGKRDKKRAFGRLDWAFLYSCERIRVFCNQYSWRHGANHRIEGGQNGDADDAAFATITRE